MVASAHNEMQSFVHLLLTWRSFKEIGRCDITFGVSLSVYWFSGRSCYYYKGASEYKRFDSYEFDHSFKNGLGVRYWMDAIREACPSIFVEKEDGESKDFFRVCDIERFVPALACYFTTEIQ